MLWLYLNLAALLTTPQPTIALLHHTHDTAHAQAKRTNARTTTADTAAPRRLPPPKPRAPPPILKGVAGHRFSLNMWYGDDDDASARDAPWVSPWAKAHYKLRQQEIEIEQCAFLLQAAVDAEDYSEANGLQERIERLTSQHPILPREARIESALAEKNYALAAVFQEDLDRIKENLGLPRFEVGQTIRHKHRPTVRGVVINVDLVCVKGRYWVGEAGCLERALALGIPPDECNVEELQRWTAQPFYTVLPDLAGYDDEWEERLANRTGGWAEHGAGTPPREIWAWEVNRFAALPPPLYLAEQALELMAHDALEPRHPELSELFRGCAVSEHRGRIYSPAPRLRLWQQEQAVKQQEVVRTRRQAKIGYKLGDGTQWLS